MTANNNAVEPVEPNIHAELKKDFYKVGYSLSMHHGIFYQLFSVGKMVPTNDIPTAGVGFDAETKRVMFYVNPTFWKGLKFKQKQFIMCHEMLHVIWRHIGKDLSFLDPKVLNIAADIVINEALISEFRFSKTDIDPENIFVWHDKIFSMPPFPEKYPNGVAKEKSTEYYYLILEEHLPKEEKDKLETVDDHSKWGNPGDPNSSNPDKNAQDKKALGEAIQDAIDKMSPEDQKDLKDKITKSAGKEPGNQELTFKTVRVKPNYGWRKIIRHINGEKGIHQGYTWTKEDKRLQGEFSNKTYMLPAPGPTIARDRKPTIWLFMDVSGSCIHMKEDFWAAKESIPKSLFNVRTFIFNTEVNEVKNKNFRGGGGTSFRCIENFLMTQDKYPNYVWVLTDAEGGRPNLKYPKRWYWFLDQAVGHGGIPNECNIYNLTGLKKQVHDGSNNRYNW